MNTTIENVNLLTVTKITFGVSNYKETNFKTLSLSEYDKVTIVVSETSKDGMETCTLYRGLVKHISTKSVRNGSSPINYPKYFYITIDCSKPSESIIEKITLDKVIDIKPFDYIEEVILKNSPSLVLNGEWVTEDNIHYNVPLSYIR